MDKIYAPIQRGYILRTHVEMKGNKAVVPVDLDEDTIDQLKALGYVKQPSPPESEKFEMEEYTINDLNRSIDSESGFHAVINITERDYQKMCKLVHQANLAREAVEMVQRAYENILGHREGDATYLIADLQQFLARVAASWRLSHEHELRLRWRSDGKK